MPQVARIGDQVLATCSDHGSQTGIIVTGVAKAKCDGLAISRENDTGVLACGHTFRIIGGSNIATVDGVRIARVGDPVEVTGGASGSGTITTGSPTSSFS